MLHLGQENFFQPPETVQMKVAFASLKVHGEQQSGETQVVIAMQVADKNVIDLLRTEIIPTQLVLATFAAVDEELMVADRQVLCRSESPIRRQRTTGTENGQSEVGHFFTGLLTRSFNLLP